LFSFLCCCLAWQEVNSLPQGPEQVGASWYAAARLAYSTVAVRLWDDDGPLGKIGCWRIYLSRIMDKGCRYNLSIMWDCLTACFRRCAYDDLVVWSDCGPSFRCREFLGSLSKDAMDLCPTLRRVGLEFGAPKHFKSVVDRKFGEITATLKNITLRRTISEVEELQTEYTAAHAQRIAIDNMIAPETYICFMPGDREKVKHTVFKLSSTMAPVMGCYSWSATRLDSRRKDLHGRGIHFMKLTNILFRAHLLTGHPSSIMEQGHPVVDDEDEPEGLVPPIPDEDPALLHTTQIYNNWRVSYRRSEPERPSHDKFKNVLKSRHQVLGPILHRLPEARRHKTDKQLKLQSEASGVRSACSATRYAAGMKARRF
jgi:hypothetical protein